MIMLRYRAPAATGTLLVMLPGAGINAEDFAANGMVAALQRRGLAVDVIAAAPALERYLDGQAADDLHRDVIAPALAQGYARIWLLGISLGGMGALLYASAHAERLAGIVLLAPFLGTQGTIAGIRAAGGLASFTAGPGVTAPEARMLAWLRELPSRPAIFLGFGEADRFAPGHRLLAARLPPERVLRAQGGHDWDTWTALWQRILDAGVLQ